MPIVSILELKGEETQGKSTFLMVSSIDRPPCQGLEFFLMQVRLAMLCHFLSSSFL